MKSRHISLFVCASLALLIAAAPLASFAKNNGNGNGNGKGKDKSEKVAKHDDDGDDNGDKPCWRAFGHLIAPGWIKHNGPVDLSLECSLPFGIAKKLRGKGASSTPDTAAPVISAIIEAPGLTSARITWATNEPANSKIYYSTTSPVAISSTTLSKSDPAFTTYRTVMLNGLSASTTYHYLIVSADRAGNAATSSERSFTTAPVGTSTSPTVSLISASVGSTTARISWKTDAPARSLVLYSTSTPVDPLTARAASSTALTFDHEIALAGLATSTTYYFTVTSANDAGTYSVSGNSFLTAGN